MLPLAGSGRPFHWFFQQAAGFARSTLGPLPPKLLEIVLGRRLCLLLLRPGSTSRRQRQRGHLVSDKTEGECVQGDSTKLDMYCRSRNLKKNYKELYNSCYKSYMKRLKRSAIKATNTQTTKRKKMACSRGGGKQGDPEGRWRYNGQVPPPSLSCLRFRPGPRTGSGR